MQGCCYRFSGFTLILIVIMTCLLYLYTRTIFTQSRDLMLLKEAATAKYIYSLSYCSQKEHTIMVTAVTLVFIKDTQIYMHTLNTCTKYTRAVLHYSMRYKAYSWYTQRHVCLEMVIKPFCVIEVQHNNYSLYRAG
jgi:hypothetical protein